MNDLNDPYVSVIIPFYNEEQFLEETIQSVLDQDYVKWELLLIDDGSTNKSTSIAKKFATDYPHKIIYLEHDQHANKGVCVSRNLGVEKARGQLIALLDADDKWLPNKLTHQVSIFKKHPEIGFLAEASYYWSSWSDSKKEDVKVKVGGINDIVITPPQLLKDLYPLGKGVSPCPCAITLKKEAILRVGGFEESFHKEYQLYEDQAFLCKVYLHEKAYISSAANNLYRQRQESVVKWVNENGHYHKVRKFFLEWLELYFKGNKVRDRQIIRLLKRARFPYQYSKTYFFMKVVPSRIKSIVKKWVNGNK